MVGGWVSFDWWWCDVVSQQLSFPWQEGRPTKMPVALVDLLAAHQLKEASQSLGPEVEESPSPTSCNCKSPTGKSKLHSLTRWPSQTADIEGNTWPSRSDPNETCSTAVHHNYPLSLVDPNRSYGSCKAVLLALLQRERTGEGADCGSIINGIRFEAELAIDTKWTHFHKFTYKKILNVVNSMPACGVLLRCTCSYFTHGRCSGFTCQPGLWGEDPMTSHVMISLVCINVLADSNQIQMRAQFFWLPETLWFCFERGHGIFNCGASAATDGFCHLENKNGKRSNDVL